MGQASYRIQFPFATSAYAGSEFHLMIHSALSGLDNRYIPGTLFTNESTLGRSGNAIYRLVRLGTYEFYLAYIPAINQHEYFGHLGRAKLLGASPTRYEICLWPPSGGTAYWGNFQNSPLTPAEMRTVYLGGVEASSIFADVLRQKIMRKGRMTFQESMLYLGTNSDLATYVLFGEAGNSNDVMNYLNSLNQERDDRHQIGIYDLRAPVILSQILDPLSLLSAYNLLVNFLWKGNSDYALNTHAHWHTFALLPSYSFELHAQGPHHYLESWILLKSSMLRSTFHTAAFGTHRDFGIQLAGYGLLSGPDYAYSKYDVSVDLRYWHSGAEAYHNHDGRLALSQGNGYLANVRLLFRIRNLNFLNRTLAFGMGITYKTGGYTKGYPLAQGWLLDFGVGYVIQ